MSWVTDRTLTKLESHGYRDGVLRILRLGQPLYDCTPSNFYQRVRKSETVIIDLRIKGRGTQTRPEDWREVPTLHRLHNTFKISESEFPRLMKVKVEEPWDETLETHSFGQSGVFLFPGRLLSVPRGQPSVVSTGLCTSFGNTRKDASTDRLSVALGRVLFGRLLVGRLGTLTLFISP